MSIVVITQYYKGYVMQWAHCDEVNIKTQNEAGRRCIIRRSIETPTNPTIAFGSQPPLIVNCPAIDMEIMLGKSTKIF